jgi:subtilisin family serine protease
VSGTIGASGGNGIGVAGVNWSVSMISGKFLGTNNSGSTLDSVEAIDYMTTLKTKKGLNIVALNASFGSLSFSQAQFDAVTRAAQANILFVAAAMNRTNNNDVAANYPSGYDTTASAGYDSVISVAAIDKDGALATFSDWGATSVDLGAPGVSVYSTTTTNSYATRSGTSMATPHVTGAIALYASTHPGSTPQGVRNDLLSQGVRPLTSLAGKTATGGSLDVGALMSVPANALAAPAAPANVQPTVISAGRVDLQWIDQSRDELGFAIERSKDGGSSYMLVDTVGANITTYSDRTARPGTSYLYRVAAYNPGGSSGYAIAASFVITPTVVPPTAPSTLTASAIPRNGGVNLAWRDNSTNEDQFIVQRKTGANGTYQTIGFTAANAIKFTDTATMSRTTYIYRVRAYNAGGNSGNSNEASVTTK